MFKSHIMFYGKKTSLFRVRHHFGPGVHQENTRLYPLLSIEFTPHHTMIIASVFNNRIMHLTCTVNYFFILLKGLTLLLAVSIMQTCIHSLPKTNSSPLQIGHPKRRFHFPTIHFQGLC